MQYCIEVSQAENAILHWDRFWYIMPLWRFLDYCTDDHPPRNLIQIWYGQQSVDVQAEFDATVAILGATEDWRKVKEFRELIRKHAGLGALRCAVRSEKQGKG